MTASTRTGAPSANGPTLLGAYASLLYDYLHSIGVDLNAILSEADLAPLHGKGSLTQTSRAHWLGMVDRFASQFADPDIALKIGETFQIKHLGQAGHVLISCATLGEAGQQVVRYNRLMGDVGNSRVSRNGAWAQDVFEWPENTPPPPALEQIWAAATVSLGRWLTGRSDWPWEVHFRFPHPGNLSNYERIFKSTPLFGQPASQLVFPSWVLDLPIATGNAQLRLIAETQAKAALDTLHAEPDILRRIRPLIEQHMAAGDISLDSIAPRLGLSTRTLHRRLNEAGCHFRELIDQVRQARAEHLLVSPDVSLAEIAFMLGYGEQSTFQHAFKRWTGQTPGDYRAHRLNDPLRTNPRAPGL